MTRTEVQSGESALLPETDEPKTERRCEHCGDPVLDIYRPTSRARPHRPRFCSRVCYLEAVTAQPAPPTLSLAARAALLDLREAPRLIPHATRRELSRLGLVAPTGKRHRTVALTKAGRAAANECAL